MCACGGIEYNSYKTRTRNRLNRCCRDYLINLYHGADLDLLLANYNLYARLDVSSDCYFKTVMVEYCIRRTSSTVYDELLPASSHRVIKSFVQGGIS